MICLSATEMDTIREIIDRLLPDCRVLLFGSRYTGTDKKYADVDLAIICDAGLCMHAYASLTDAFAVSDLAYRVDIVDYNAVSLEFRQIIDAGHAVIYP